ncbi:MAG: thrombospondin type 3 repeat-containing protein [Sandaracinaceae bacterium]
MRFVLSLVIVIAAASPAAAQSFPRDDFSAHRFYVAPGPNNFVLVDGGEVGPNLVPTFGATMGYLHRPFAVDDLDWYRACEEGRSPPSGTSCGMVPSPTDETDFVGSMLTLQLYGAVTFLDRIQVGLNLPVVLYGDGERYEYLEGTGDGRSNRVASNGGAVGGLTDPRVSGKIRILDPDSAGNGVTLSAVAWVSIPIGHYMWEQHFMGDPLPQVGGHVVGGFRYGDFRLALNLGGVFREELQNIRSQIGAEAAWGLAAAYRPHPLVEVLVEANGWTSFGQRFDSEAPTEIRGALNFIVGDFTIQAGAGAGLVYGVGVPVAHGFVGASFSPPQDLDTDGDGVTDSQDACPADAEDEDGWEDEDGCPELDNDGDGIPDADDPCPDDAEDLDEFEDEDGCPEEDNDGDGIRDGYDSCPNTPEDMDGDRDTDGCPEADRDNDGIEDSADQCPTEAEDFDGFADEDGCPEEDFDGDGVPDTDDECPAEAEDMDDFEDEDGCPEEGTRRRRRRGR